MLFVKVNRMRQSEFLAPSTGDFYFSHDKHTTGAGTNKTRKTCPKEFYKLMQETTK